ncbi:hypothetical protein SAMN04488689_102200 [Paenibacillus sp. cl6col]|nr:hypothetical protein SAMN04488689_102200 [Paenibacillus sp. cl6col]
MEKLIEEYKQDCMLLREAVEGFFSISPESRRCLSYRKNRFNTG